MLPQAFPELHTRRQEGNDLSDEPVRHAHPTVYWASSALSRPS